MIKLHGCYVLTQERHGYREGDQNEQGNRVSITHSRPMPLDQFKVIQNDTDNQ